MSVQSIPKKCRDHSGRGAPPADCMACKAQKALAESSPAPIPIQPVQPSPPVQTQPTLPFSSGGTVPASVQTLQGNASSIMEQARALQRRVGIALSAPEPAFSLPALPNLPPVQPSPPVQTKPAPTVPTAAKPQPIPAPVQAKPAIPTKPQPAQKPTPRTLRRISQPAIFPPPGKDGVQHTHTPAHTTLAPRNCPCCH
jgi:hypothetical protein